MENFADKLARTKAEIAALRDQTSQLRAELAAKIALGATTEEIAKLKDRLKKNDELIEAARDRQKVEVSGVQRQRHEERLKERETFLAGKWEKLEARNKLFEQFEKVWIEAGKAYRAAMGARAEYLKGWREDLVRMPGDHDLRSAFVTEAVLADITNFGSPDYIGTRTKGIAAKVAEGADAHFERLRVSSMPPDDQDIEEAA